MDYIGLGVIGFIVGLSGAMLPGPMLIYAISKVLQTGAISIIPVVLGHIFIEAVMVILILLGLKQIIGSTVVYNVLSILGAGVLVLMGMNIFFRASQMKLPLNKNINFSSGLIMGGMFFTAFNPTFPTWWVSVGATLLSRALLFGLTGVIILVLGHWLADFTWFSLLGFAVGRGRSWLNDRRYQLMLKILGLTLFGFGLWFICQVN